MSHGPTVCSPSTFLNGFDEGSGRTQSRRVRCESGSQSNFAPQVAEIRPRMECMAGKRCRFSLCQTDDFVFSPEIEQTSACGTTLTPKDGHLFRSHSSCYYFESPSGHFLMPMVTHKHLFMQFLVKTRNHQFGIRKTYISYQPCTPFWTIFCQLAVQNSIANRFRI